MGQPKRKERSVEAEAAAEAPAAAAAGPWVKPAGLSQRGWAVIAVIVIAINFPIIHYYVLRPRPAATQTVPYRDDYSNVGTVAENYWTTGGLWRVVNGQLLSPGVKNNPLWLKDRLPENAVVEFDVRSESPEGDIKCEIFGDGSDHASGYVLIHGGWNNSISVIARLDEHGEGLFQMKRRAAEALKVDANNISMQQLVELGFFRPGTHMRVEANPYPVQLGRTYHWRIERRGSLLQWSIDGAPFMQFDDPFPLTGEGHNRFAFSSWEAQLYFDNLTINPL